MGNEHSKSQQISDLEIDEKAVEVTDFWVHYSAKVTSGNARNLSVLIGEPLFGGSLWINQTPLEKNSKNLMLYRHPNILKYVKTWSKHSKHYLVVEDVKPLSHVLSGLGGLEICIGLHSVLKALCFLHEKAAVSHNNVCLASIYITKEGNWKLGGMEYLCGLKDLNLDYLVKTYNSRYEKAIDPNETKTILNANVSRSFIDVYAYGVLACEVLKNISNDELPYLSEFRNVCKNNLQNIDVSSRMNFQELLDHPFFNHDFIIIHSFLTELPLKSDKEKTDFFQSLIEKLKQYNEEVVASQLGNLLLSRMVLLNKTAQTELLPYILQPNQDEQTQQQNLFSTSTFKKHVIPRLSEIFCVRDAEIRKLLLRYFTSYVQCFTKEQLQNFLLPELLVGIKDTNDELVAETLRALSAIVPILGSETVIGGKRAKLFNDGRPTTPPSRQPKRNPSRTEIVEQIVESELELPERQRPDGEEGDTSAEDQLPEDDLENWEDWDGNDTLELRGVESVVSDSKEVDKVDSRKVVDFLDITALDIKSESSRMGGDDEFNFFEGMEPVIVATEKFLVEGKKEVDQYRLLSCVDSDLQEDGWDDEWVE